MCGIVGYVGPRDVIPVLTEGLSKLEYRGYDSAGVAYLENGQMRVVKAKGRLSNLKGLLGDCQAPNTAGIGHTRWATHGEPSDINSHPHTNTAGNMALVHNGIIENFSSLKEWLISKGIRFVSDTDTEVAVHLINYFYEGDLRTAVSRAVRMIEGSYAFGVLCANEPERIVAVRKDSPLVVGVGKGENLIASDVPALLAYTRDVYFLEDDEVAVVERDKVKIYDEFGNKIDKQIFTVDWDVTQAEKAGYEHFMIKEIHEQPKALYDTLMPRIQDGKLDLSDAGITPELIEGIKKIIIIACGTASYAGYMGRYVIERLTRVPVEVDIGSEFRYRNPILEKDQMVIVISQSGETADTIAAMREARSQGLKVLAITNVKGSTVSREADAVFYTQAGMEIAVASTKAYITQVEALYMVALEIGRIRGQLQQEEYNRLLEEMKLLPEKAKAVVENKEQIQKLASQRFMEHHAFYIGRGLDYALAMEASLKLKEVSYVHSEAYAAGELKHGTIALIEENTLVVALLTQKDLLEKTMSNIKEVKARGAYVFALTQEKYKEIEGQVDEVFTLPDTDDIFAPILGVIPMQMLGYYLAVYKGCDVDKPRNLAKSVTVE